MFRRRAFHDIESQAIGAVLHALGAQRGGAALRHRPDRQAAGGDAFHQGFAVRVVNVDHRGFQPRPVEQRRLGVPVSRHATVVVEMVLREVGEHRHLDGGPGQTVLGQTDG